MRSHPQQPQTTALHTPKRKKQEMTCAEQWGRGELYTSKKKKQEMTCAKPPPAAPNYRIAHAKKKKTKNDVCGATPSSPKLPYCTRQKRKSRKRRVWRVGKRGTVHGKKEKSRKWRVRSNGAEPPQPAPATF